MPVHQAAGHQEIFDGVNTFRLYYQVIVFYIKHFDDAGGPDTVSYTHLDVYKRQV